MSRTASPLRRDPPVDPASLSPAEREGFTDELHRVHEQIFDGVEREAFRRYVVEPSDADTRIQVFRDPEGAAAGYVAIHGFRRTVLGTKTLVVRSEVGVVRRWRGSAPQAAFVLSQCLRLWLCNLGLPKVVLGCPVHPSSFWGVTRRAARSWPRPGSPTPPKVRAAMVTLADQFELPRVAGADPLVRRVGWVTRDSEADRAYWEQHRAPEVRFFRAHNPGYTRGEGLTMMVPLTLSLLVGGGLHQLRDRIAAVLRRRRKRAMAEVADAP